MTSSIHHLFQYPQHTGTVAGWIYREFWEDRNGYDQATLEKLLGDADDPGRIPLSLIALADGVPAGTVNLIYHDNARRPELTPWLAALVVVKKYRGRGIGSALVKRLLTEASRIGISTLYLGTDTPDFYTRLGAFHHETVDGLHIMRFEIAEEQLCDEQGQPDACAVS